MYTYKHTNTSCQADIARVLKFSSTCIYLYFEKTDHVCTCMYWPIFVYVHLLFASQIRVYFGDFFIYFSCILCLNFEY